RHEYLPNFATAHCLEIVSLQYNWPVIANDSRPGSGDCMFVTHLESSLDGTRFPANSVQTVHQGRPLWVRCDLDKIRNAVAPSDFSRRDKSLWRYRELLPLPEDQRPVSLGEGWTPLLHCPRLGRELRLPNLYVKDESQLPTGSFKARGMTVAVSM